MCLNVRLQTFLFLNLNGEWFWYPHCYRVLMAIHLCRTHGIGMFVGLTRNEYINLAVDHHATDVHVSILWVDQPFKHCVYIIDCNPLSLSRYQFNLCIADVPGACRQFRD